MGKKIGQKLAIFWSNFCPQTTTSCGQTLLFLLFSTILHHYYTLNVARLLHLDVECVAKFALVRGNLSKRVFAVKHTDFYPCTFSETGQRPCSYLYYANPQICRPLQDFAPREQVRNPIASTLILPVTEFVLFSASAWTWIITSYLLWPVCSFLNHKWYFAIIHKRKLS